MGERGCDGFLKSKPGFATTAIHAGQDPDNWKSLAVVPPIVTATTFKQASMSEQGEYQYGRSGNPSRNCLEACMAALEDAKFCLAFASGLSAASGILSLMSAGDHLISSYDIYGGTSRLLNKVVSRLGIEITYTDITDTEAIKKEIKKNTKMIWLETPTNPLLKVADIEAVVKTVKQGGNIMVVVDNTFLTPYLQRPLDLGADIVMYSLTKYMNGHSDVIMGAATLNDADLEQKLRFIQNAIGAVPSPFDCYLINRSLKTLALRMERHKSSALRVAEWLEAQPCIEKVYHPGLKSHPQHELFKKQTGGHSGVFSFKHTRNFCFTEKIISSLKVFVLAESLGGYESIVGVPTAMSHRSMDPKVKAELGITESLIRVSIGLEDPEDLIQDFHQALEKALCACTFE